ncbi:MAG: NAD(P) transhydrogenase subunit alpha [Planctomycetes bacterium]|nr:NAD(P) transhydrogenase subunit alpha [Planctomycetota bacterium]
MIESIHKYLIALWVGILLGTIPIYAAEVAKNGGQDATSSSDSSADAEIASPSSDNSVSGSEGPSSNRIIVLIGSLTIFVLAVFVGFEVINKVPPTLHTPLMSGSNAISGITIVGAILATGFQKFGFGSLMGFAAIVLAMINVAGGFWVTHRMLVMFKKK